MRKKKESSFKAKDKRHSMPDTNEQGWGSITGAKTQVSETESNGVRTISRTAIDA